MEPSWNHGIRAGKANHKPSTAKATINSFPKCQIHTFLLFFDTSRDGDSKAFSSYPTQPCREILGYSSLSPSSRLFPLLPISQEESLHKSHILRPRAWSEMEELCWIFREKATGMQEGKQRALHRQCQTQPSTQENTCDHFDFCGLAENQLCWLCYPLNYILDYIIHGGKKKIPPAVLGLCTKCFSPMN